MGKLAYFIRLNFAFSLGLTCLQACELAAITLKNGAASSTQPPAAADNNGMSTEPLSIETLSVGLYARHRIWSGADTQNAVIDNDSEFNFKLKPGSALRMSLSGFSGTGGTAGATRFTRHEVSAILRMSFPKSAGLAVTSIQILGPSGETVLNLNEQSDNLPATCAPALSACEFTWNITPQPASSLTLRGGEYQLKVGSDLNDEPVSFAFTRMGAGYTIKDQDYLYMKAIDVVFASSDSFGPSESFTVVDDIFVPVEEAGGVHHTRHYDVAQFQAQNLRKTSQLIAYLGFLPESNSVTDVSVKGPNGEVLVSSDAMTCSPQGCQLQIQSDTQRMDSTNLHPSDQALFAKGTYTLSYRVPSGQIITKGLKLF